MSQKANANNEKYEQTELYAELATKLTTVDFSRKSNKEAVYRRVRSRLAAHQVARSPRKAKAYLAIAASVALVAITSITFIQPSFAKDMTVKIIRSISLGNISVMQVEPSPADASEGVKVNEGQSTDSGTTVKVTTSDETFADKKLEIVDKDKIQAYASFPVILPSYLPEGYQFTKAELYKNEDGNVDPKYVGLYYTNTATGKFIYMQQRMVADETSFGLATDSTIKEAKVNGAAAVIVDGRSIDWQTERVMYSLSGRGAIDETELVKIAESVK